MSDVDLSGTNLDDLLAREWIAVNHLGGYASSTVAGLNTRKYHGLLVAVMAPPVRRMVLLSGVHEKIIPGDSSNTSSEISSAEYPDTIHPRGYEMLRAFSSDPFPRWAFQGDGWTLEKTLRLPRGSNSVVITYTLLAGSKPVTLELRPLFALRKMHELMYQWNGRLDAIDAGTNQHRIPATSRSPEVFFAHDGKFTPDSHWYLNQIYRREIERGYGGLEDLWNPGAVRFSLKTGSQAHFACSTERIEFSKIAIDSEPPARQIEDETLAALIRAADQFVVDVQHGASKVAVAGNYHWSSPNVRDALIALPGLFLVTRRLNEAKSFLNSLAGKLKDGLIPTEFPEDSSPAVYSGADTSLWFIHAVHQFARYSGDARALSGGLLDACMKIVEHYRNGSAGLGITCDESGLISSHVPGAATSWLDAKVGSWVITPRQGRTVELNALWYNALRVVARFADENNDTRRASELSSLADSLKIAFNEKFWNEKIGCCNDVVMDGGADASIRPNQIFAIALPHALLATDHHAAAIEAIESHLLTPVGLRTLSPDDPAYQGRYAGDVVSRDRAYHQGSAYPWLLGPFICAQLKVRGCATESRATALDLLRGCFDHLQNTGQIAELFHGDEPHNTGGAIACVRSVGELLRCYWEDILHQVPESFSQNSKFEIPKPPLHR